MKTSMQFYLRYHKNLLSSYDFAGKNARDGNNKKIEAHQLDLS